MNYKREFQIILILLVIMITLFFLMAKAYSALAYSMSSKTPGYGQSVSIPTTVTVISAKD